MDFWNAAGHVIKSNGMEPVSCVNWDKITSVIGHLFLSRENVSELKGDQKKIECSFPHYLRYIATVTKLVLSLYTL